MTCAADHPRGECFVLGLLSYGAGGLPALLSFGLLQLISNLGPGTQTIQRLILPGAFFTVSVTPPPSSRLGDIRPASPCL